MQSKKEQFLLLRIRAFKDEKAFESLVAEHGPALKRFFYFKMPNQTEADDAYATTLMRVWQYISRTEVSHFRGLMYAIAKSVVADFYRSRELKPTIPIETEDYQMDLPSKHSGEKMEQWVDGNLMRQAIMELEDDDRDVITLKCLEGYSTREVAEYIGKSENNTSVILHRALKKLRENIEKKGRA